MLIESRAARAALFAIAVGGGVTLAFLGDVSADRTSNARQCYLNSDCPAPYVCDDTGICQTQCAEDRDCDGRYNKAGSTCVKLTPAFWNYCAVSTTPTMATPQARPGPVKTVAVSTGTELIGADPSGNGVRLDADYGWRPWAGLNLVKLAAGRDGAVWGITTDDKIYQHKDGYWRARPGLLRRIHVADAQHVCGVTGGGAAYSWTGSDWIALALPSGIGALQDVSCGRDGTMAYVGTNGNAWLVTTYSWRGTTSIAPLQLPGKWSRIDLLDWERIAGIDDQGNVVQLNGGEYRMLAPARHETVFEGKRKTITVTRFVDVEIAGQTNPEDGVQPSMVVLDAEGTPFTIDFAD